MVLSLAHAVAGRQRSDTLQNRPHGIGRIEDCRPGLALVSRSDAVLNHAPALRIIRYPYQSMH